MQFSILTFHSSRWADIRLRVPTKTAYIRLSIPVTRAVSEFTQHELVVFCAVTHANSSTAVSCDPTCQHSRDKQKLITSFYAVANQLFASCNEFTPEVRGCDSAPTVRDTTFGQICCIKLHILPYGRLVPITVVAWMPFEHVQRVIFDLLIFTVPSPTTTASCTQRHSAADYIRRIRLTCCHIQYAGYVRHVQTSEAGHMHCAVSGVSLLCMCHRYRYNCIYISMVCAASSEKGCLRECLWNLLPSWTLERYGSVVPALVNLNASRRMT